MCPSGSSQLKDETEKFNDVSIVTESLGMANISSQSSNVTLFALILLVQPVNFNFSTFFLKSSRFEYDCFGLVSCRTSLRLGAVVEVEGMLFSGRLRVGTAPGSSLWHVGTKPKPNQNCHYASIISNSISNIIYAF